MGEVGKDAPIALFVGIGQRAAGGVLPDGLGFRAAFEHL